MRNERRNYSWKQEFFSCFSAACSAGGFSHFLSGNFSVLSSQHCPGVLWFLLTCGSYTQLWMGHSVRQKGPQEGDLLLEGGRKQER